MTTTGHLTPTPGSEEASSGRTDEASASSGAMFFHAYCIGAIQKHFDELERAMRQKPGNAGEGKPPH